MSQPVCVNCGHDMRCTKTGQQVVLAIQGNSAYVAHGDKFDCPNCDNGCVVGVQAAYWLDLGTVDKGAIYQPKAIR